MIKRLLQIAAFTLLCTTLLNAQNTMKVVLTDGSSQSYSIESLKELVFLGQAVWKVQIPSQFEGGKVYLIVKKSDGTTEQIEMTKSGDVYVLSRDASIGDEYTYGVDFGGVFYTDKEDYYVSYNFIMDDDASDDDFREGLKLSTNYVMLEVGKSQIIKAFWQKSEVTPDWLSNNKAIATITAGGVIYGVGKGSTTITATYKGQTQSCTVQVDNGDPRTSGFNYYVFYMDDATFETIGSQVAQDYRVNDSDIFFDVYEDSYKAKSCSGLNAYGQEVEWLHLEAQKIDWDAGAAGIRVQNDIKLSKIDGSYNLHIDYKSSDNAKSYVSLYNVATDEEKQIPLPTSGDGQWHSFDKSIGELGLDASWFTDYKYTSGDGQTVVGMKTEGIGKDLEWCAIYLYQHSGFVISQTSLTLKEGTTSTIKAYKGGVEVTPVWTSDNTSVATVSAAGEITAKGAGTAKIKAALDSDVAECTVTVKAIDPRLEGFNYYVFYMDGTTFETIGSQVAQDYRVNDSDIVFDVYEDSYKAKSCSGLNAYGQEVEWLHLEAQKASWNAGAAGIRVKNDISLSKIDGSYNLHIDYKSSDNAKSYVSLYNVATNEEKQIPLPTSGDGQWHSFDKSIGELGLDASWFTDYKYTEGDGQTVVGMKTEGVGKDLEWCAIYLYQHNGLVINPSLTLKEGTTSTIKAYKGGVEVTPTWTSDNTSVATVSAAGEITAKGAGTAKIKATLDSDVAECTVTVKAIDPRLEGFNYYVFYMDDATFETIGSQVAQDYRINDDDIFFDIYENSYESKSCEGLNAYGQDVEWLHLEAQKASWNAGAAGIRVQNDIKLSKIDGSYNLHIDYKSSDNARSYVSLYNVATNEEKQIPLPTSGDGQWHSFDKSIGELGLDASWFTDYKYTSGDGQTVVGMKTEGVGKDLEWCAIYLYQHNGLVINPSLTLKEGTTSTIKAYKGGVEVTPTWTSDNTSVATVSAAGEITAKGAGTAKIKATLDSDVAECTVTVKAIDPRLEGFNYYVLLMDEDTYGDIEDNVKYDYRVNDSDRFFDIYPSPSSPSYKEGTCIGKNAYGKEETWLSLIAQSAPWSGVGAGGIRSKADVKLSELNESYRLHVDYKSSDGALNELCIFNMSDHTEKWIKLYEGVTDGQWHSFDKSIKEMKIPVTWFSDWTYSSGNGEYIIGVRTTGANKQLDWCSIFLYQPAGLILNTTNLSLESGQTDNLVAYFDGAQITPTWSSSSTSVATVDASGKITAIAAGNVVITAKYQGKQVTCTVNVTEPDPRLKGSNYYVFMLDDITYSKISSKVTADYRVDDSKKFLQIWEGSYAKVSCEGKNAYGQELDWASLIAQQNPWYGVGACGLLVNDNISMSGIAGSDYADYYLHVDYKLTSGTTKQEILLYNVYALSTDPAETVELPTNKGADGWYSYEASLSSLNVSKDIFTDFVYSVKGKNVIGLRTTGAGKQFDVCGLYIYKPAK